MPTKAERQRERYFNDPEYRERVLKRQRERYFNDSEYRERKLEKNRERNRQRYLNDPEYRERERERGRSYSSSERGQAIRWLYRHNEMRLG
jgi:hypothetical protein